MRAGAGMAEEGADLVRRFGRQDVFELAGLLFDFGFAVQGQAIGEQALGQPVAANDVGRALTSAGSELDDHAAIAGGNAGRLERIVARIHERLVIVRLGRMRAGWSAGPGRPSFRPQCLPATRRALPCVRFQRSRRVPPPPTVLPGLRRTAPRRPWRRLPASAILPWCNSILRSARRATTGSCVTITMVRPC